MNCQSNANSVCSRDENVVGILDKDVSRKLQLKDLTLALTIETVWQFEEVASQVSM